MEAYPDDYTSHNIPLIALSGLGEVALEAASNLNKDTELLGHGPRLTSDLPVVNSERADAIKEEFLKTDGDALPWNTDGLRGRSELHGFKYRLVGRNYVFPARKAAPPPQAPSTSPAQSPSMTWPAGTDLHSPLSPLSPSSPLYPDGILLPQWVAKHKRHLPSVFVSFYDITPDQSTANVQDNQIKTDINAIKTALLKSGYKTRYAAVLVCDKTIVASAEVDERLNNIRRATGLDPKSGFFFLPPGSQAELSAFVTSVLSALQPQCVEYYRDLTKHARRKKTRGFIPLATGLTARGSSQSLTTVGWNVRYEFKQGVFAEFRQEMDAAERHYSFAIEELFNPEGVLESTSSWSARWEEARCLTDITAIRVLRCQLWRGMTSGAAESWVNYKDRMFDLVNRRGKGTTTYGWAAWESRWAEIMAQLLVRAELAVFQVKDSPPDDDNADVSLDTRIHTFALPEKAFSAIERLPPFHFMHHPGYWYRISSKRARSRQRRSKAIPEEDRRPPEQTPPPEMADRIRRYDTYMVPPPHEEMPSNQTSNTLHIDHLYALDEKAALEFGQRKQTRSQAHARLDQARLLAEESRHEQVVQLLRPLWQDMQWRNEQWFALAAQVISVLHNSAKVVEDEPLMTELDWERMSDVLRIDQAQGIDVTTVPDRNVRGLLSLDSQKRISPITITFAFATADSYVGEWIPCQVTIVNSAASGTPLIEIKSLELELNGNPHRVRITHEIANETNELESLNVKEGSAPSKGTAKTFTCSTDLRLGAQQRRILNFTVPLRDAGSYFVTDARIELDFRGCQVEYVYSQATDVETNLWWLSTENGLMPRRIHRKEAYTVNVLPKPPKVMLRIANLLDQYFTNETVTLDIDILNQESESVNGVLNVELLDTLQFDLAMEWKDGEGSSEIDQATRTQKASRELVNLEKSGDQVYRLTFAAPIKAVECSFTVGVVYTLASDPDAPVTKTLTLNMSFVSPFEANYDLLPQLDTAQWPSFFHLQSAPDTNQETSEGEGVPQVWSLISRIASFAHESIIIESGVLVLNTASSNATCTLHPTPSSTFPSTFVPKSQHNLPFTFTTRKTSIEDRRPSSLDLSLQLTWRRSTPNSTPHTSTLLVPKLTIPGPEPRVLCTRSLVHDLVNLTYTLENPSMHFLTFTITMDATDQFAFSGPKHRTIALTPLSRVSVHYRILAHADKGEIVNDRSLGKGRWIAPALRVVDAYFAKTLRVMDAGTGVKSDKKSGTVSVFIPEDM